LLCLQHFVNTQMMVHAEPKLLRTLRRSDVHSDKVIAGSVLCQITVHASCFLHVCIISQTTVGSDCHLLLSHFKLKVALLRNRRKISGNAGHQKQNYNRRLLVLQRNEDRLNSVNLTDFSSTIHRMTVLTVAQLIN